jgi:hypothetical protein
MRCYLKNESASSAEKTRPRPYHVIAIDSVRPGQKWGRVGGGGGGVPGLGKENFFSVRIIIIRLIRTESYSRQACLKYYLIIVMMILTQDLRDLGRRFKGSTTSLRAVYRKPRGPEERMAPALICVTSWLLRLASSC